MSKDSRARQLRRQRQRVERRRTAESGRALETQQAQREAAARQSYQQQQRRHRIAYVFFAVAAVMAVSHVFEHAGAYRLLSPGLDDLAVGWPMAGVIAVVGAIIYGT